MTFFASDGNLKGSSFVPWLHVQTTSRLNILGLWCMLTLFIILSSHCLSAHNITPCSAEVEIIFSNSRSMTSNCIPMIPSLNLVSLDRSQSTSGKRSQALTKCPNKKRPNVWLEPRKQNRSPPPPQDSYSTPTFPSGYVDEGLTLNLTPMDFNLSNKNAFPHRKQAVLYATWKRGIFCSFQSWRCLQQPMNIQQFLLYHTNREFSQDIIVQGGHVIWS